MNDCHICLISGQAIPNLLPLLQAQPGRAIFLVSPEMKDLAARLQQVAAGHGVKVSCRQIGSAYDYAGILQACEDLIKNEESPARLVLNVTGGTKIAALAAFQAFFFADSNNRIIYCDTEHDRLLQLAPEISETPIDANLITAYDYLACYGLPVHSGGRPPAGATARRPFLARLADLLVRDEPLQSKLHSALEQVGRKTYANISVNALGRPADKLVGILETCGVARQIGAGSLNIPNEEALFFCKGGWLEEFVYWAVHDLNESGLEPLINVKVAWDGGGKKSTENEFDVIFTFKNRLHIISCKAANPERQTEAGSKAVVALNELETLSDRAGGLFGKAMLVSSRRISDYDRSRAEKMRIKLVDGLDVLNLQSHLRRWLRSD